MIYDFRIAPINPELSEQDRTYIENICKPSLVVREIPEINFDKSYSMDVLIQRHSNSYALFFTSGTTAFPKGVEHSVQNMISNVIAFNESVNINEDSRLFHVLPMFYMAGFLNTILSPLVAGGTVILGERFSPLTASRFWSEFFSYEANLTWTTPTIIASLLRLDRSDKTEAKRFPTIQVFCGTAPLDIRHRSEFEEKWGFQIQQSYGTSELLLISAQDKKSAESGNNVGPLLNGIAVKVVETSDGFEELGFSSPFSFNGYRTVDNQLEQGEMYGDFHLTGDIGNMVDDCLVITGRIKDIIIRGGINISPVAIERIFTDIEGVLDVAVVGAPHDFWGEEIVLFVETGHQVPDNQLLTLLKIQSNSELAAHQRPSRFVFLDEFPRTVTGKIQKKILRDSL